MKYWHASWFAGKSGISKYAAIFFDEVLSSRGYERLELDELGLQTALDCIDIEDVVHVEIGVNQTMEIALVMALLSRGHSKIDVTLHDPPFLAWPLFRFKNRAFNQVSKVFHLYLRNFGYGEGVISRLRRIYTLSNFGSAAVMRRYRVNNVTTLPLVVGKSQFLLPSVQVTQNMLFFGFIGANKSLNYALELHRMISPIFPDSKFLVIGDAIGDKSKQYLTDIKEHYSHNVEYLGFVPDASLAQCFSRADIAILPFSNYRTIIPVSASTISAMAMGKVVFANPVNAIPELIRNGYNGIFLTGNATEDSRRLSSLLSDSDALLSISKNAIDYLREFHNPLVVGVAFDQGAC